MTQIEKHSFQAEVNEVLSIVVNSLYSHEEVFLRELISNASDALDKLSFRSLTEHELLGDDRELRIELIPDAEARTLTIRDNGVGMTKDELIENLGTIARSGSKKLVQSLTADTRKDLSLIGQFGVGFYSAYLVADRVTVTSRAAGAADAWQWASDAKGEFTLERAERAGRGTDVVLHLKDDKREFSTDWQLRSLVRKYSDYVRWPIRLRVEKRAETKEGEPAPPPTFEFETINSASALWTRPKSEITQQQYEEFYKHLSHDWSAPLAWTHFKVEGAQELTGLLFLPSHPPFDLFDRKPHGVRLFVKRVFIMEDCSELLPEWLRFVRGVVDSQDLPLNVSRELLQQDRTTQAIRKQVVAKTLTLLEELAKEGKTKRTDGDGKETEVDRYAEFWRQFGRVLKEGVHHDPQNRDRIAALLRWHTTHDDSQTSLADYVSRMVDSQPGIYYVNADSLGTAQRSPHIEALKQRGYEVLLMVDPVDEWVVDALGQFSGKKLIAAAKGSLELPQSENEKKLHEQKSTELKAVLDKLQTVLDVKEVRVTDRLTDSPACLVSDPHALSPHVERLLRANGQDVPEQPRILELNPDHPVVQRLKTLASEGEDPRFRQWAELIYDSATLAEGALPKDPTRLARAVAQLLQQSAG